MFEVILDPRVARVYTNCGIVRQVWRGTYVQLVSDLYFFFVSRISFLTPFMSGRFERGHCKKSAPAQFDIHVIQK